MSYDNLNKSCAPVEPGHSSTRVTIVVGSQGYSLLIRTRTAEITVEDDAAGPIVIVRVQPGVQQSLEDARDNMAACTRIAGNRRCRLLIDISKAEIISAEGRHFYSGGKLTEWFSALALQVEASPMGRVMGNLYLRIARPGIPTRLFADSPAAIAWLMKDGR